MPLRLHKIQCSGGELVHQAIKLLRGYPPMNVIVNTDRRCASAVTQAINRCEGKLVVRRCTVIVHSQAGLDMLFKCSPPHGLTCFRAANMNHSATYRMAPEVVIEADNPMHFSPAQLKLLCDNWDRTLRDIPKMILHRVENRQKCPWLMFQAFNYPLDHD